MIDQTTGRQVGKEEFTETATGSSRVSSAVFFGVVAAYCGWILSLPVFPTQDGPVHLYYVRVLEQLFSGSSLFSQFFAVRHPLPPYSLNYYLILLLHKFTDLITAEKLVVCLIVAGFAYGFRFLIRRLGSGTDLASYWAIPLALNWMLGMGFHNYCLSISVAMWAMGLWLLAVDCRLLSAWLGFLALVVVMLLTHPVPLFVVLAFVAGELVLRAVQGYGGAKNAGMNASQFLSTYKTDALFAALAYSSLAYIALFVSRQRSMENLQEHYPRRAMLHDFIRLKPLSLVANTTGSQVYRLALYFALASALLIAATGIRRRWRTRSLGGADLMLAGAVALGLVIPLLPRSMNGSDFFADRLLSFVWIGALAAAACGTHGGGFWKRLGTAGGCLFALGALLLADRSVRPVARQVATMETIPIKAPGQKGIFLDSPILPEATNLTFDPFNWTGARYFRRTDTVMLNAPWIDLPILPVEPRGNVFANLYPPRMNNYPQRFRLMLIENRAERERIAPLLDFVVPIGFEKAGSSETDALLKEDWPTGWDCQRNGWFSVCTHL